MGGSFHSDASQRQISLIAGQALMATVARLSKSRVLKESFLVSTQLFRCLFRQIQYLAFLLLGVMGVIKKAQYILFSTSKRLGV